MFLIAYIQIMDKKVLYLEPARIMSYNLAGSMFVTMELGRKCS
jgi:hypothetical protein